MSVFPMVGKCGGDVGGDCVICEIIVVEGSVQALVLTLNMELKAVSLKDVKILEGTHPNTAGKILEAMMHGKPK